MKLGPRLSPVSCQRDSGSQLQSSLQRSERRVSSSLSRQAAEFTTCTAHIQECVKLGLTLIAISSSGLGWSSPTMKLSIWLACLTWAAVGMVSQLLCTLRVMPGWQGGCRMSCPAPHAERQHNFALAAYVSLWSAAAQTVTHLAQACLKSCAWEDPAWSTQVQEARCRLGGSQKKAPACLHPAVARSVLLPGCRTQSVR